MASPTEVFSQGVQPDTSIEPNLSEVESIEVEPLLWKFPSALLFIIIFTIAALSSFYGVGAFFDIQNVKDNWAEKRCSPLIIPFASIFGYDTEENFTYSLKPPLIRTPSSKTITITMVKNKMAICER